jgi:hypothetical protein
MDCDILQQAPSSSLLCTGHVDQGISKHREDILMGWEPQLVLAGKLKPSPDEGGEWGSAGSATIEPVWNNRENASPK